MPASPTIPQATRESERVRLEETHHELCTALTSVRSHVALVRIELGDPASTARGAHIASHLVEVETAVDRLVRLASTLRAWHSRGGREGG